MTRPPACWLQPDTPRRLYTGYTPAVPPSDLYAQALLALDRGQGSQASTLLLPAAQAARAATHRTDPDPLRAGRGLAAAGRRAAGDRGAGTAAGGARAARPDRPVASLAHARAPGRRARRAVPRHRVPHQGGEPGGARARLAGHRPGPLRARALLSPGRRHRHRPRSHHAGGLGAPRRRRQAAPGDGPLAVRHHAGAGRAGWTKRWRRCVTPSGWRCWSMPATSWRRCAATRRTSR